MKSNKDKFKKMFAFFAFFLAGFAFLYGVGYSIYESKYLYTIALCVLGAFAYPKWIECFKYIKG